VPPSRRCISPYKGGAEALADLLGGRIDFYFCPISTALPFIREGRVVPLVVSTPKRAADLPAVPTTLEAGYPNSESSVWFGVFMPSRTPRVIVERLHAVGARLLATPAMQQKLKQLAVDPMPLTPAEMDRFVVEEIAANGRLIRAAGIKVTRRRRAMARVLYRTGYLNSRENRSLLPSGGTTISVRPWLSSRSVLMNVSGYIQVAVAGAFMPMKRATSARNAVQL
jgi:hypothetical protein